jgi:ParB-like chromosome segregation protein Spo0J
MGDLGVSDVREKVVALAAELAQLIESVEDEGERMELVNAARTELHQASPMKDEPADLVLWVRGDTVQANDYNPNQVAPPEMRLLKRSVSADGYTMPVVTWIDEGVREVVDGFHRRRVGLECKEVKKRTRGWLPVTTINQDREGRNDRISSTIRHNRARGKHQVQAMSEIVQELTKRNWSAARIGRELGMDEDEVLRLRQITGLAEAFADHEFSKAWEWDPENALERL